MKGDEPPPHCEGKIPGLGPSPLVSSQERDNFPPQDLREATHVNRTLALALALIGAFAFAWWNAQTPAPLPANAPTSVFSAGRAMVDNRVIARTPHPIGSPANAVVRDYLVQRMSALGLNPQVQAVDSLRRVGRAKSPFVTGGHVENVIGVLPGKNRDAPAIALMAHYDSVPGSPGAADDAAGVSAALEVIRLIKAQGTPERDVILLITDGEEAGLLGAAAFFPNHPLAKHVGFIINMETRGGGGAAQMFQTGPQNGEVIKLFAKGAVRPSSSSLAVFLYENMPNDTDFTVSKAAGVTGLNFAFIGRQFDYHSPTSTSDNLDQGSLQHMGDQAYSAAKAVAFSKTLPGKSPNVVYSATFGSHILSYSQAAGWALLAAIAAWIAIGVHTAKRAGVFRWPEVARGAGGAVYLLLTAASVFHLARRVTGAGYGFFEQRTLLAQVNRWELALALLGVAMVIYAANATATGRSRYTAAALAAMSGTMSCAFGFDPVGLGLGVGGAMVALVAFGRPAGITGAWTGVLAIAFVFALVAQIAAPPTAFLIAWPLALAALLGAISGMGYRRSAWITVPKAALAGAGLAWLLGYAHGVFQGLDLVELLALFALIGGLMVWPLVQDDDRAPEWAAFCCFLAGLTLTLLVRLDPPWTPRHPQATLISYVQDADSPKAYLATPMDKLDPWTAQALAANAGRLQKLEIPAFGRGKVWTTVAPPIPVTAPTFILQDLKNGAFALTATPPPGSHNLSLELTSDTVVQATTLNGAQIQVLDKPGQTTRIHLSAMPHGLVLTFKPVGPGKISVSYATTTEGWPASAKPLPQRDDRTMPFDLSDSTTVVGSKTFSW